MMFRFLKAKVSAFISRLHRLRCNFKALLNSGLGPDEGVIDLTSLPTESRYFFEIRELLIELSHRDKPDLTEEELTCLIEKMRVVRASKLRMGIFSDVPDAVLNDPHNFKEEWLLPAARDIRARLPR